MCETDVRRGCHHDPLSLLKNCDATALGKLCETVSGMGDDTVAYANFPKRSLVKCFSARDKYEWHVAQTAELQNLERIWTTYKKQIKKKKTGQRSSNDDSGDAPDENKSPADSTECDGEMPRLVEEEDQDEEGRVIKAARQSPSPLVVNEEILREALMVAEHFEENETSSSTLSSDQKSPVDNCENEVCTAAKFNQEQQKQQQHHRQPSNSTTKIQQQQRHQPRQLQQQNHKETSKGGRSRPSKLMPSSSLTTPRQRDSSHIFSEKTPQKKPSVCRPHRNDYSGPSESLTSQVQGSLSASTTPRRGKLTPRTSKASGTPLVTPRKRNKAAESPRLRNIRSTGDRLRGAFGGCLGSKHASIDLSSSHLIASHDSPKRPGSMGPSTRRLFGGNRTKKSPHGRLDHDYGSLGSTRFRSSGEFRTSTTNKAWK